MVSKKPKPETIADYIKAAPQETQQKLRQMHECIRAAAPGARESLKWNMPAYSYRKILVTFAVFKHHIGFYPMASAVKAFTKNLTKYKTAEGSMQFPLDQPLPLSLIGKITLFRVKESLEGNVKWRS